MTNSLKTVLLMALDGWFAAISWRLAWRSTRFGYGVFVLTVDELWNVLVFQ